ncbi:MAG: biotin/lipoate A/B protein ligase family protein [Capsulimonadaceae bacterium]
MLYRWILEPFPLSATENMRRDTVLLDEVGRGEAPAVRVYGWSEPAVTIGRLQDEAEVRRRYPDQPIVRRPTGGRAVLHGNDLTVAVATRAEWLPGAPAGVLASYTVIVAGLVDACRRLGIDAAQPARRARTHPAVDDAAGDRIACFATVAGCDVADARTGAKLIGSAQRREGGVLLQQMSFAAPLRLTLPVAPGHTDNLWPGRWPPLIDLLPDTLGPALGVLRWEGIHR